MIIQHLKDFFRNPNHLIISSSLIAMSSLATYSINEFLEKKECVVNKWGYVYFKNSDSDLKKMWIETLGETKLFVKDTLTQQEETIPFNNIKKLEIYFEEEIFDNQEISKNPSYSFVGNYKLFIGEHEGFLSIYYTKSGILGGYVQFPKWGKGKVELLKWIQIQGNQISFTRSCEGKECIEIGAPYSFKQTYIGNFNTKGELEGKYTGTQSSGQWKAIRIQN